MAPEKEGDEEISLRRFGLHPQVRPQEAGRSHARHWGVEEPDQLVDGVLLFRTDVPVDPGDLPFCLDRLPGHAYGIVATLPLLQQRLVLVGHDDVPQPANDAEASTSFPNFSR